MIQECKGFGPWGNKCHKETDSMGLCDDCRLDMEAGIGYNNADAYEDYKNLEIQSLNSR